MTSLGASSSGTPARQTSSAAVLENSSEKPGEMLVETPEEKPAPHKEEGRGRGRGRSRGKGRGRFLSAL